ncbi:SpoIIIAH-like family protein [Cohnella nanjingensis]|uniref:SpoIIIAH-like family protein n=1 Tax=Cohnella nanjingensis TaxID=1387779 RepID=A0A7X0RX10_9BACL|nr:SpoIIIAH-like family protein [Cohnella nanjingensis]MBB6675239.1 SpoIIIAH-like family protein [Cohnella nanjingensis]
MNNKRQTIWLVSMLSLMVILSAYYLFTEDAPAGKPVGQAQQQETQGPDAAKASGSLNEGGVQVTEVDGTNPLDDPQASGDGKDAAASPDASAAPGTGKDAAASPDTGKDASASPDVGKGASASPDKGKEAAASPEAGKDGAATPEDKEVLKGMTNLTGREYFDNAQLQREIKVSKRLEELNAVLAATSKATPEEAAAAAEEQSRIDMVEQRITSLEEKLVTDYGNAVVEEDDSHYKVVVQAAKLEAKQAVKIVSLATKELAVTPDRISVQYIQ